MLSEVSSTQKGDPAGVPEGGTQESNPQRQEADAQGGGGKEELVFSGEFQSGTMRKS